MRNVIAEMLVRRELANVPPPVLDEVPGLSHRSPGDPATTDSDGRPLAGHKAELALAAYERDRAAAYLSRFGECVVRVNPAGSKALLMSDEGTATEAAAFSALSTALGTCVAEGRTLNFDKWTLKGSIAVNYYRLAMAARNAPSSTAAR
jgi:hypothetical protein